MSTKRILTDAELRGIKLVNDSPKVPHGRPVKLIGELLDTIYYLKQEKKKWQRVAEKRKKGINDAMKALNNSLNYSEDIDD